jgi:uncharacterized protein (TIGR02421 family)
MINKKVTDLDARLFELVRGVDILDAIAPVNYRQERAAFFDAMYSKNPEFLYQKHSLNPFLLKRDLFNLPLENIDDADLVCLYSDIIDSYVDKVDQYKSLGTPEFLYDSLRYYGEPSEKDIRNAHFILHLPEDMEVDSQGVDLTEKIDASGIQEVLEGFARQHGYQYDIRHDENMIANALVSGTTVKINGAAQINRIEANALAHHELGVHLLTTLNARSQPLKILSIGCPVNTMTQEGLAILSEYLAGFISISRLKVLALRVMAVKSMIADKDFRTTFLLLKEQYKASDHQAFTITTRVYRGGGFTKDYLYLQGFHQMLNLYQSDDNFNHLLAGKTSVHHLATISRLIEKGLLLAPSRITPAFTDPVENSHIHQFIAHAIK